MHPDEVEVSEALVRRLLASQLPELAHLAIEVVEPWGTDNAIWRLGDELSVRLPRIGWASRQPAKEAIWIPHLAPHLAPLELPEPVALGRPMFGYPFAWSVQQWVPGDMAAPEAMEDPIAFARDLAAFVRRLRGVDVTGAPPAHNRARPLAAYDEATRATIESARHLVDADAALAVWEEALAAEPHTGPPVWVQGDLDGNCLIRDGRLCGVVDWGSACAGDPAVDVAVAWSPLFTPGSRQVFLDDLGVDDATLARSRGAAVHQSCAALPYYLDTYPLIVERSRHKLAALGIATWSGARGAGPPDLPLNLRR